MLAECRCERSNGGGDFIRTDRSEAPGDGGARWETIEAGGERCVLCCAWGASAAMSGRALESGEVWLVGQARWSPESTKEDV